MKYEDITVYRYRPIPIATEWAQVETYLTRVEAATYAKVSTSTIIRWIKRGYLEGYLYGKQIFVNAQALQAIIEE